MKVDSKEIFIKYQERFLAKTKRVALKYLQKVDELPDEPKELEYFKNILKTAFVDNKIIKSRENEKIIGTFCVTMPSEIIRACNARPIRLCSNSYIGYNIGESMASLDMCPLSKSVISNLYGDISFAYKESEMFILPLTCDCKKNLLPYLSNYKPTEVLHVPYRRNDDEAIDLYINELKQISNKISLITGTALTKESLKKEIEIQAEAQKEILLLAELKLNDQLLIRGTHSLLVMNSMAFDDISNWTKHLKLLNEELLLKKAKQNQIVKKKSPRILLAGSPITFPNIKLPLIIEQQGGVVVADETCLGERGHSDMVSIFEDSLSGYYRALANRYIKPCSCAFFPDNLTRINKINELVNEGKIDGIVYHNLHNCLVYDYEYQQIEEYFSKKGIPVIKIESDSNDEDLELISVRISAFLEMITFANKGGNDNV